MNIKKIQLLESQDTDFDIKNRIIKGLNILDKYCNSIHIEPEHDTLYIHLDNDKQYTSITDEDMTTLGKLGLGWDDELECFYYFT